jgi:hypothetical protein
VNTLLDTPEEEPPRVLVDTPGFAPVFVEVPRSAVRALRNAYQAKVWQNHKMHQEWNEGPGDFAECTRGDCTEARAILKEWEWMK